MPYKPKFWKGLHHSTSNSGSLVVGLVDALSLTLVTTRAIRLSTRAVMERESNRGRVIERDGEREAVR